MSIAKAKNHGLSFTSAVGPQIARHRQNLLAWMKTFRASGKAGVVSMLHAEDWSIMAEAQERLMNENGRGGGTLHNFAQSAPIVAEVLAVQRGMAIAEATGSPIYILHVSCCIGLSMARLCRLWRCVDFGVAANRQLSGYTARATARS